jgi:hypothetical protein
MAGFLPGGQERGEAGSRLSLMKGPEVTHNPVRSWYNSRAPLKLPLHGEGSPTQGSHR